MKDYNEMLESLFERREKYNLERKKKMNTLIKAVSGTCCLCLVFLSGLWAINNSPAEAPEPVTISSTPTGTETSGNGIEDAHGITPAKQSQQRDNTEEESPGIDFLGAVKPEHLQGSEETAQNRPENDSDVPVSEQSPGSFQNITVSGSSADFFGGSYTNAQGQLCVLLTADTAENRQTICREKNLNESKVIFQQADYTLSYLTKLQAKISQGMIDKELSFVTVSSLREDLNRIELTVTTEEEELLAKLKALDTIGGALEIRYGSGVQSLISKKLQGIEELPHFE